MNEDAGALVAERQWDFDRSTVLGLLIAGSVAAWVMFHKSRQSIDLGVGGRLGDPALADRLAKVEAETNAVRRELAGLRAVSPVATLPATASAASPPQREPDTPSVGELAGVTRRVRQNAAMAAYEEELELRGAGERIDRRWGAEVENGIRAQIGKLDRQVVFQSAMCGASFCKAIVGHQGFNDHLQLLTELRKASAPGLAGQVLMRRHEAPEGGYRTTIYISKAGEHLPALDETLAAR